MKKGTTTVNAAAEVKDKNTLILTTTAKITDADYTVTIGELSSTFKGETETLTKFELASNNAVVDDTPVINSKKATVAYLAQNQFGEAMNISVNGYSSFGTVVASKGLVTITFPTPHNFREGDTGSLAIYNTDYAKTAEATLSISAQAAVKNITVEELYNKDKKELTGDTNLTDDKFYLILSVQDQYGNEMTDINTVKNNILVSVANTFVVNTDVTAQIPNIVTVNDKLALQLTKASSTDATGPNAGSTNVMFMTKNYGTTYNYEVSVAEGTKVNKITLSQPDAGAAYVGEGIEIPFEAIDMYGKVCTDLEALKGITLSATNVNAITGTTYIEFQKNYATGKIVLKTGAVTAQGPVSIIATTKTGNTNTLLVTNVKEKAVPNVIVGVKADKSLAVVAATGSSLSLKASDFVVYDQYDRKMEDAALEAAINSGVYAIKPVEDINLETASIASISFASNQAVDVSGSNYKGKAVVDGVTSTLTKNVTFALYKSSVLVADSSKAFTFTNVARNGFSSYTLDVADKIYAPVTAASISVGHKALVKVYGVTSNGLKVLLPGADATGVSTDSDMMYSVKLAGAGTTVATYAAVSTASPGYIFTNANHTAWDTTTQAGSKILSIFVVINENGKTVEKSVTVSEEASKLTTLSFDTDNDAVTVNGNVNTVYTDAATLMGLDTRAEYLGYMIAKDQYGVVYDPADMIIVISDETSGVKISNNATGIASVTELVAGSSYKVKLTVPGGLSVEATFIAK